MHGYGVTVKDRRHNVHKKSRMNRRTKKGLTLQINERCVVDEVVLFCNSCIEESAISLFLIKNKIIIPFIFLAVRWNKNCDNVARRQIESETDMAERGKPDVVSNREPDLLNIYYY